ncbi:nicotinate (nicotinamide) nucleotide adenylyltransferase [Desulfarculus baarsii DSM 2075]|uniref:Probable nicotinate-nucleotide adenylyltransferase n=1 Tax=Desulfarculus baarsii (strain ATCC 33931 / DSM 2075 / LMG 7858 / VKM B-1802 / 2st14) TaxID=644282 RepID=E1QJM3_DESB2|nr:nicotinate-nucleotide adenylyltransferase [Desulfarculus baarsii]ADK85766.1 nicotinate (nicotinamide) nucleotide adenylyltransferase [Desulfarculus baarsii DSM 2075]
MAGKIAIFGGTFDPIHIAHLRGAIEVAEALDLPQVRFVPCATPPHRKDVRASLEHRLAMCRLAVEDHPLLAVSDMEASRGGVSRTIDTLRLLREANPEAAIYFIIGADAFFYLHTWYEARRLFDYADFVVMDRPRAPRLELLDYMRERLDPSFAPAENGWVRLPGGGHGARRVLTTLLDVSSTYTKRKVARGRSISFLVPQKVEAYIKDMKLYQDQDNPL